MAELSVSRKNIVSLFEETKNFVIPEYQRPYSWDKEKCDVLWSDIQNFHVDNKDSPHEEYFLGTIVFCKDKDTNDTNVIDGQQRITSLLLLLRAFYKKLEEMQTASPDEEIDGLMKMIAPGIWDVNPMSKRVTDKNLIHIRSLVVTEKDNDAFHHIMINGETKAGDKSHYSENFSYFLGKCNEYAKDNPLDWKNLCLCILNQCIVLPIECNNLDDALTIFSTLNDRGLELADSDIFKAEMYKSFETKEQKTDFIEKWKELTEITIRADLTINDIFRYYTHVLRGLAKDKTKEIGLRKYYSQNRFDRLKESELINTLVDIAEFWDKILKYDDSICSLETKKMIHCLKCYPNDFWRYPLTVLYYYNKTNGKEIKEILPDFLRSLVSYLFVRFVESQSINPIKDPVYQFCIDLASSGKANISYVLKQDFKQMLLNTANTKIAKPLILLNSYLYDENSGLIPSSFDVEHIFPQKWDTNYFNWTAEEAEMYVNQYGNKIPLEKKLNIQAGNGFYSKKKQKYSASKITEIKYLLDFDDWTKNDIANRSEEMANRLTTFFANTLVTEEVHKTLLLKYTGGDSEENITKEEESGIEVFVLSQTENGQIKQNRFDSFDEALSAMTPALKKYGKKEFVDDSIKEYLIY